MGLGLKELIRLSKRGECPFCGEPQKQRNQDRRSCRSAFRKRDYFYDPEFYLTCGDPECKVAYRRYYARDKRHLQAPQRERVSRAEKRRRMSEGQQRRWET